MARAPGGASLSGLRRAGAGGKAGTLRCALGCRHARRAAKPQWRPLEAVGGEVADGRDALEEQLVEVYRLPRAVHRARPRLGAEGRHILMRTASGLVKRR